MSRAALLRRLGNLEQRRQRQKGPPRPWFGFRMDDGGPGEPDGWVETRTMEEAVAEGALIFTFGLPGDAEDE